MWDCTHKNFWLQVETLAFVRPRPHLSLEMLDLKPSPRTHAPPAKAWRNYCRVYRVLNLYPLGPVFPGIHPGPSIFPSKEIAESHAVSFLAEFNPPNRCFMDFVGAYPEGERAN